MDYPMLFHQQTTYNPNYTKCQLPTKFTQQQLQQGMHRSLYNKYSYAQNYYYTQSINNMISEQGTVSTNCKFETQFNELKEYMNRFYKSKESPILLKMLIHCHQDQLVFPRFFLQPVEFELLVEKHSTRLKKLKYRQLNAANERDNQQVNRFNLTKQFIKQKLIRYQPILADLSITKPTTEVMVDLLKDIKTNGMVHKSILFIAELEKNRMQQTKAECHKIKQFDEILSRKNSDISASTKLTNSKNQTKISIQSLNNNNSLRQKQRQLVKPKLNIEISQDLLMKPCMQSTRLLRDKINLIQDKPYLSPNNRQTMCKIQTIYQNTKLTYRNLKVNKENLLANKY